MWLRMKTPRGAFEWRWCRRTVCAVAIAVLCACAQIPDLGAPVRPQTSEAFMSSESFKSPRGDWPTEEWWRVYGDSQLDDLMGEALRGSPTLAQASARLREAEYRAGLARAGELPNLSFNAAIREEKLTYRGIIPANAVPRGWNDFGRATLDFSWELDFWAKNRLTFEAALSEVRAGEAEAAAARVLLTTSVAQAYVQLQDLFVQLELEQEAVRNREASEHLVLRRVAEGLETQATLAQASSRTSQAIAELAAVNERLLLSRNVIAALLGKGPDRGIDIGRSELMVRQPFGLPASLSADLLGRRPEVVAARWRVEAAAKRIGVAKTAFYPNVNLVAFIGFESLGLRSLGASGSDTGAIGPAIHLPIFDGGALRASYGAAGAQYDGTVAIYDATLTQVLRETADAARSLQALDARLSNTQAALGSGEKAYRIARRRYEAGLTDYQSVLSTEDAVLQLRQAETELRTRGVALDIALIKALGGGFASDSQTQAQVTP